MLKTLQANLALLTQSEWWKSMVYVLLRTLIAGIVPLLLAYSNGQPVAWLHAALQLVLLLILAILTSLAGIPIPGTAPYWTILGARFLRQFAQFLIAGIGTAVFFTDVDWKTLLVGAVASALSTVLLGSLALIPTTPMVISGEVVGTPQVMVYSPAPTTGDAPPVPAPATPQTGTLS